MYSSFLTVFRKFAAKFTISKHLYSSMISYFFQIIPRECIFCSISGLICLRKFFLTSSRFPEWGMFVYSAHAVTCQTKHSLYIYIIWIIIILSRQLSSMKTDSLKFSKTSLFLLSDLFCYLWACTLEEVTFSE